MKRALPILAFVWSSTGLAEAKPAAGPSNPAPAAMAAGTLTLEPMMIYGDTRLAFGFGLMVTRIESTRLVLAMQVDRVRPGSDAEQQGLKPGSRIVSINGKDVSSYEATFEHGSELNRIFVDRQEGARVTMQVLIPGKKKLQKLTIVRRTFLYDRPKIGGLPFN